MAAARARASTQGRGADAAGQACEPEGGPGTSFHRVAEATGSAVLQQPVTVGALCASLPDLAVVPELCGAKPRALSVQPIAKSGGAVLVMSRDVEAYVVNLPAAIATAEDTASALRDHLLGYPTVAGWALPDPLRLFPPSDGWGAATVLRWRVSEDVQSPNEPDRQARMREVAPQYRHSDQQWCRPAVAPGTLLSIDHSELAVPLEGVLVDALEVVPHLVLDALQETPLLLRPIPRYGG